MRVARALLADGTVAYGSVTDNEAFVPLAHSFAQFVEGIGAARREPRRAEAHPRGSYTLLAPCEPTKVVAVGLNYRDHAEELGMELPREPLIFLKPPSAVIGPGAPIVLPPESERVDYEAELAVVIGRRARRVTAAEAPRAIFGYTCANDVTARDLQACDGQWTRAKGFDTFCPLGPWIVTDADVSDREIRLEVDGVERQRSRTSNLVFSPAELVAFASSVMTLEPGDVILTGTPSGIGKLFPNQVVCVTIESIGSLSNPVVG